MMTSGPYRIQQLGTNDVNLMHAMLATFGEAFNDAQTYGALRPSQAYFEKLLGRDSFIALVALKEGTVVGGLAAYELRKFEQERSEIYIYDLAVSEAHRRKGIATALQQHCNSIATALIAELRQIAATRGAWVIFVQADYGDTPAIQLYEKLGLRENVMHFDIAVEKRQDKLD